MTGLPHFETLSLTALNEGLLQVTLNRPDARNAMNTQMGRDLRSLFQPLAFTPGDTRCIVLTGSGEKAFCAGGDLKERNGMTDDEWRLQHAIFEEAVYAIMDCAVPVIAAVNGAAFGGGCEIALACDFVYAAPHARFALTEVTLGIMPGCGGTQNLPRALGNRRAKELLLTGRPIGAEQAAEWGLVNAVHPLDQLVAAALDTGATIASNAPVSVRQIKRAVDVGTQLDLKSARVFEVQAYERTIGTDDRREGVAAFNEKRTARFLGR